MKRIEWFWNIVYYNIYRYDVRLRKLFNYLNPFYLINNIPTVKKFHAKHGVDDMNKFANRVLNNPKTGISRTWTGSFMGGLLVLIEYGLFNIFQIIIGISLIQVVLKDIYHFIMYLVILVVPSVLVNNYLLFRKDKYLDYFKEFEIMTDKKKTVYGWLSFFVVILIFSFFMGSFLVL
jgi:hypothetical protein